MYHTLPLLYTKTFNFLFYHISQTPTPQLFPTRRSSDLRPPAARRDLRAHAAPSGLGGPEARVPARPLQQIGLLRSEEHTSELQSHSDLVCRLLLEKKKKKKKIKTKHNKYTYKELIVYLH